MTTDTTMPPALTRGPCEESLVAIDPKVRATIEAPGPSGIIGTLIGHAPTPQSLPAFTIAPALGHTIGIPSGPALRGHGHTEPY